MLIKRRLNLIIAKQPSLSQYGGGAATNVSVRTDFESELQLPSSPWRGVCELGFQAGLVGISSGLGSGVDGSSMAGATGRKAAEYGTEGCGGGKG